ncbi:hypothetical protein [Parasphingorhabdus sp.]
MSEEFWAIVGVGIVIVWVKIIVASENEKRLDEIIDLLHHQNRD